jgi:hypothetical protein
MQLINNLLLNVANPSENVEGIIGDLKDAKKLNLNDEIKCNIVKSLTNSLESMTREKINAEACIRNTDKEKNLISSLIVFKSNCCEEYAQFLLNMFISNGSKTGSINGIIQAQALFEILFENCGKDNQKNAVLTKIYMEFSEKFVSNETDLQLIIATLNAHTTLLKNNRDELELTIIDKLFAYLIKVQTRSFNDVNEFCTFYDTIGQYLFVIGNFHQKYFKSRVPQYFKAYEKYLNAVYFYKNESSDHFEEREVSMLLKLTLQLEK